MLPQQSPGRSEEQLGRERGPSLSTIRAAISLLTDQDPVVTAACRSQILTWGDSARQLLVQAISESDPALRRSAKTMLRRLDLQDWHRRVADFAGQLPRLGEIGWETLERGALLLSNVARPEASVDAEAVATTLDGYAEELAPVLRGKSATSSSKLLAGYLSQQLGYGGSRSSYYEPSNVRFDQVVSARRGVPVTLALLFLLVGRRAGLTVTGVAIPDHFLVRVHGVRPVLLDPYHEGRQVTKADCVRYLRIAGYSLHTTSYLEDVHDVQILDCLLRDLLRVYGYREDNELCSALETARQTLARD